MTKKPCPGCGEVHPDRRADSVCYSCKRKIDEHEMLMASLDDIKRGLSPIEIIPIGPDNWESKKVIEIFAPFLSAFPHDERNRPLAPDAAAQEAFQKLRNGIFEFGRKQYSRGYENGSTVLRRLAQGDVSMTDFEFYKNSVSNRN
jgi:hypothetical protein